MNTEPKRPLTCPSCECPRPDFSYGHEPCQDPWHTPPSPSEGPKTAGEAAFAYNHTPPTPTRVRWSELSVESKSLWEGIAAAAIAHHEASKEKEATGNPWDALRLYGYKGGCVGTFLNAMHTKVGEALMLGEQVERLNAKLASLEGMYAKVVSVALDCGPISACERKDNQLEPPWEVFARVKQERDDLRAKLAEVVEAAESVGWNGVENSKSLAQFIKDLAEERDEMDKWAKQEIAQRNLAVEEVRTLKHRNMILKMECDIHQRLLRSPNPTSDAQKEEKPWTLPPPPEGQQWHRDDWTQEMLPDGWRPLLKGEYMQEGDESGDGYQLPEGSPPKMWRAIKGLLGSSTHCRTRRPLPAPPTPNLVPLEASDVPPGSFIKHALIPHDPYWWAILNVDKSGVWITNGEKGLMHLEFTEMVLYSLIQRPGSSTWEVCSKEEP